MLIYVEQDIFQSPAQVIVNTVNTVGVMGKGIAKRFKSVYPVMFNQYKYLCENHLFDIGELWLYKEETKWVLNFPTKKHWRNRSELAYVEAGLKKFVETYAEKNITSISFPQLGCGNGGLDWLTEVKPLMEKYLKKLPIDVYIHLYKGDQKTNITETKKMLKQNPQLLNVNQLWHDLKKVISNEGLKIKTQNDELGEQVCIKNDQKEIWIHQADIQDMWLKLRDYGYLLPYDIPNNIQTSDEKEIVFHLMKKVSYIQELKLANTSYQMMTGLTINRLEIPGYLLEEPVVINVSQAS